MEIVSRGYPYKEDYWETKDHKIIKISDMETSHILNTIKFLEQRPDFYKEEYIENGVDILDCFYQCDYNKELVDKKIQELYFELVKRKVNGE